MRDARVGTADRKFAQDVVIGPHALKADEPKDVGGDDSGPAPHEWLLAGLGACTSMTLKMYADRKEWPLERCDVTVSLSREGATSTFHRTIVMHGPLDDEQRKRLMDIAAKCPVHQTLTGQIVVSDSSG